MYELRIASGLHRGATLPLDEHDHVIGAHEDAEVVLADSGIDGCHATLSLTDLGWTLRREEGEVFPADSHDATDHLDLSPGEFARLGNVWLTVVEEGEPWQEPPELPVDLSAKHAERAEHGDTTGDGIYSENPPHKEDAPEAVTNAPGDQKERTGWVGKSSRAVAAAIVLITLISAATYAMTQSADHVVGAQRANPPTKVLTTLLSDGKRQEEKVTAGAQADPLATDTAQLSREALRAAFRKRLSDAELLKRFELQLNDDAWTMQGALDEDEIARFERILASFVHKYRITFPVSAKVGNGETILPFKIQQVISGVNAHVVTQEGDRLYIGDRYRGVLLASIEDTRLVFVGKRKIEVKW